MQTQQPTHIPSQPDLRTDPRSPVHTDEPGNNHRPDTVVIARESKPGVRTSEFWIMLAVVGATLLATYADEDSLARVDGWRLAAIVAAAYIVSRGVAKIGTADRKVQDRN